MQSLDSLQLYTIADYYSANQQHYHQSQKIEYSAQIWDDANRTLTSGRSSRCSDRSNSFPIKARESVGNMQPNRQRAFSNIHHKSCMPILARQRSHTEAAALNLKIAREIKSAEVGIKNNYKSREPPKGNLAFQKKDFPLINQFIQQSIMLKDIGNPITEINHSREKDSIAVDIKLKEQIRLRSIQSRLHSASSSTPKSYNHFPLDMAVNHILNKGEKIKSEAMSNNEARKSRNLSRSNSNYSAGTSSLPQSRKASLDLGSQGNASLLSRKLSMERIRHRVFNSMDRRKSKSDSKSTYLEKHALTERTRINWTSLISNRLILLKLVIIYKRILENHLATLTTAPMKDENTLRYMLRKYIVQTDVKFLDQVKSLLKDSPENRKREDIEKLERLLSIRMADFRRYSLNDKIYFCKVMKFATHPPNTLILKEDHISTSFYYILSGQAEVFMLKNGIKHRINFINPGSIFGERNMAMKEAKRTASVATVVESTFLCLDKKAYISFSSNIDNPHTKSQIIETLLLNNILAQHKDFVEKISGFFKIFNYSENTVIVKEGGHPTEIFFIIQGRCRVSQSVTLSRNSKSEASQTLSERKFHVETGTITVGSWFPRFPILGSTYEQLKYSGLSEFKRDEYIDLYYSRSDWNDRRIANTATVTAETTVITAAIPFSDFVQICPPDILFGLTMEPGLFSLSKSMLQEKVKEEMDWKIHKQKVLKETKTKIN